MPTVLVMWEYSCSHSPIWGRSEDLDLGPIDARDLGLPEEVRDALADWNGRAETAADPSDLLQRPTTPQAWRRLLGESYALAAAVQRGLGDAWTVWCCAGGGDGGRDDPGAFWFTRRTSGPQLVLGRTGVVDWAPDDAFDGLTRFGAEARRDFGAWAAASLPPAEQRARGLELAGRLDAELDSGQVLWFGGDPAPFDRSR